jgi:hypothetical protein
VLGRCPTHKMDATPDMVDTVIKKAGKLTSSGIGDPEVYKEQINLACFFAYHLSVKAPSHFKKSF